MANLTIRGLDEEVAAALKKKAEQEATSVNALTVRILRDAVGLEKKKRTAVYRDLDHLAGTWDENSAAEFERVTAVFEKVDEEMWK